MEIDLININKKYQHQKVLKDITYSFKNNKVYFIIGESGCGKSTLLKVLAGVIDDYKGKYLIDGKDVKQIDKEYLKRHLITYIDQESTLIKYLSINDNIRFLIDKKVNINNNKKFSFYSGGEKRRIATYVNTLKNSSIILADEISSSLDKNNAIEILKYLREISKNKILIIVTHDKFLIDKNDIVIDLQNFKKHKSLSKRKFRYKKTNKTKSLHKILKYSLYKVLSKIKYVFNFVSSFMVGLTLILLISSLKTGILSFLNNSMLNNFNFNYLLIESKNNFNYSFMTDLKGISNKGILIMADVSFDPIKNMIYIEKNNENIYFEINNFYSMSEKLYKNNGYNYNIDINGYSLYINNVNDSEENVITCPVSFFDDYYKFKNITINNFISKECVLKVDDEFIVQNYETIIKKYDSFKFKNSGIDAYIYIKNMLHKIEIILLVFIIISLLVTFFLIFTIIRLDIIEDSDEIKFMINSGLTYKFIFNFYYMTNIYRGLVTFIITIISYYTVISFSNYILKQQLKIDYNILSINNLSIAIIMALIIVIITISVFLSYKRIKVDKN